MAHDNAAFSNGYACFAGCMITSCGWVDTLLYTLTRQRLLRDTMPNASGRRTRGSDFDNELGSKGITHTRTVTVENGTVMSTLSPASYDEQTPAQKGLDFGFGRAPSPNGSVEPILYSPSYSGKTKTEISVGQHEIPDEGSESSDKGENITALPPSWVRYRGDN